MVTTKIFFDCEFTGLHKNTTLISIGMVTDHGHTFYAELIDYDKSQIDQWLQENVLDNLLMSAPKNGEDEYYSATRGESNPIGNSLYNDYSCQLRCNMQELKHHLSQWLAQFEQVEMWSDCLAFDWVLFCDIFGTAFDVPQNVYYIPFDICTLLKMNGIDPDISRIDLAGILNDPEYRGSHRQHNALFDAQIIKKCYYKLKEKENERKV